MGLRDTAEQLDACKAQSVRDEQRIAVLQDTLDGLGQVARDQARQIAELEHDLARAESALADRLRHHAHAHATVPAADWALLDLCRRFIVGVRGVGYTELEGIPLADVERRLDVATRTAAEGGDRVTITQEEAALAIRACRHSAESIRAVLEVDPARLHPDVAPYVERLTDLADRLAEETR